MTHLINEYYYVGLPEGAVDVKISGTGWLCYRTTKKGRWYVLSQPSENYSQYSVAFTRDTQTEEGWKEIVDSWESVSGDGTPIYENYKDGGTIPKCRTAEKSGHSLLASKEIDPKVNFVIIKKIANDKKNINNNSSRISHNIHSLLRS